jgi:hypothetical protein
MAHTGVRPGKAHLHRKVTDLRDARTRFAQQSVALGGVTLSSAGRHHPMQVEGGCQARAGKKLHWIPGTRTHLSPVSARGSGLGAGDRGLSATTGPAEDSAPSSRTDPAHIAATGGTGRRPLP